MSTGKRWSYAQITAAAELTIRRLMKLAADAEHGDVRRVYRTMAYGTLSLWRELTSGSQHSGDDERLEALTDSVKTPAP